MDARTSQKTVRMTWIEEEEEVEGEEGAAASTAERQAQPVGKNEEPILEWIGGVKCILQF